MKAALAQAEAELQQVTATVDAVKSLLDGVFQSSAKSVTAKEKQLAGRALRALGE
jgi:hypothetical protein